MRMRREGVKNAFAAPYIYWGRVRNP